MINPSARMANISVVGVQVTLVVLQTIMKRCTDQALHLHKSCVTCGNIVPYVAFSEGLGMLDCRYAGAGLFDSLPTEHFNEVTADYSADRLINDTMYQNHILASIAAVCSDIERVAGSAQDIEGVVDWQDAIHIVQSRPQV